MPNTTLDDKTSAALAEFKSDRKRYIEARRAWAASDKNVTAVLVYDREEVRYSDAMSRFYEAIANFLDRTAG